VCVCVRNKCVVANRCNTKINQKILFILAWFQFPFLNIRKIVLDNVFNLSVDDDWMHFILSLR